MAKLWLDDENGLSGLRNCRRLTPRRASSVTHNYALEEALQASGENRCDEEEADEDSVVERGPLQEPQCAITPVLVGAVSLDYSGRVNQIRDK